MARRAIILGILGLGLTAGLVAAAGIETGSFKVANSCAASCRAAHDQCRIRTKGAASCDAQLSQCLRRCLKN